MNFSLTISGETPTDLLTAIGMLGGSAPSAAPVKIEKATKPQAAAIEAPAADGKITTEAVRLAVKEKTTAEPAKRTAVKKLLAEFEADSVTVLDTKHYASFLEKLETI